MYRAVLWATPEAEAPADVRQVLIDVVAALHAVGQRERVKSRTRQVVGELPDARLVADGGERYGVLAGGSVGSVASSPCTW